MTSEEIKRLHDELYAQIDDLKYNEKRLMKNYQQLHDEFSILCQHYKDVLIERRKLIQRIIEIKDE